MDWSACYTRHFEQFFRNPVERSRFIEHDERKELEILSYDGVFQNCRTFVTIGAANMSDSLNGVGEVFTAAESAWSSIPYIMANAIFYMSRMGISLGWGVSISGVEHIDQEFAREFSKTAIYFTLPVEMPNGFSQLSCSRGTGLVYMAMFISQNEHDYFMENGSEMFENLMDGIIVDPFDLARPSCV
jgi:hypothetical protein